MWTRRLVALIGLLALLSCGPATSSTGSGSQGEVPVERPSTKSSVVTIAVQREPESIINPGTTSGGAHQVSDIAHNWLVTQNEQGAYEPILAAELPSVQAETWRVNPDGGMEQTWHLRPNIKWQDGVPFTAQDIVFGFDVNNNPLVESVTYSQRALIQSVAAPDAQTLVVRWKSTYWNGLNVGRGILDPMPQHILEGPYQSDPASLMNLPYFRSQFVGVGPYRVVDWDPGTQITFSAFPNYYRGMPKIDRVIVRFIGDPNAMVSAIMADSIDVILPIAVDAQLGTAAKQQGEPLGLQVIASIPGRMWYLSFQGRPEVQSAPALLDRRVRQALYTALDRDSINEAANQSLGIVADAWIPPNFISRAEVESAIPQYPYDADRAARQLATLGWARGSDGVLTQQETGSRLEFQLRNNQNPKGQRESPVIQSMWKQIGVETNLDYVAPALLGNLEYRALFPAMEVTGHPYYLFVDGLFHGGRAASAENHWSGSRHGYAGTPELDAAWDRLLVSIDDQQQIPALRDALRLSLTELAMMPLYYDPDIVIAAKGVRGLPAAGGLNQSHTWNIHLWEES